MSQTSYLIPLQSAVNWTTAWRTADPNAIKAFRVDLAEINQILQEVGTTYFRIYFGYDGGVEKLVLVAVDANGNDIINPTVNGQQISGTYDFADPCPPVCDTNSPLYTGRMP